MGLFVYNNIQVCLFITMHLQYLVMIPNDK